TASAATTAAAAAAAAAPSTAADAAGHGAHALADLRLLLRARRLRLRDAELDDVLALAHARDHLGPVEVGEAQLDEARLDAARGLPDPDLRATGPAHAAPAIGSAAARSTARAPRHAGRGVRAPGAGPGPAAAPSEPVAVTVVGVRGVAPRGPTAGGG